LRKDRTESSSPSRPNANGDRDLRADPNANHDRGRDRSGDGVAEVEAAAAEVAAAAAAVEAADVRKPPRRTEAVAVAAESAGRSERQSRVAHPVT
jgi:hypothetical protein